MKRFVENSHAAGLPAAYLARIRLILSRLEIARQPKDIEFPGSGLHPLTGGLKGYWAVKVSANWRIIFRFDGEDVTDVDLIDYH